MRVCILAYDGLEHSLVKELKLRNILQREFGTVEVPIAGGIDDPSTPIVWTSFMTGQPPSVHGVDMNEFWNSRVDTVRSFLRRHRTLHSIARRLKIGYKIREGIGTQPRFPSVENIKTDTLFDVIQPSIALGVPVYNKDIYEVYPMRGVFRAIQDPVYREEYEERIRRVFEQEVEELFESIKHEWKLLMIHFHITDLFGHIYWGTEKLATLYEEMDLLTKKVKEELGPRDILLVISDHGMERHGHTKLGFYSLNLELGLGNPDITDFFRIVKTICEME
jgi:hypothetical protein